MKFKFYAVAPLWGAMALLVATGCTDELVKEQQQTVLPTGNGIVFEATAAYASDDAQTRTSYGDYNNPTNPTSQAINWEEDDKVDIYSPTSPTGEASGKGKKAEYDITLTDGKAYLTCNTQGLQWGDETQSFYGIYPAVESMSNAAVKERVSFEGTVLKGYVPVNQQHTITKSGTTWTATPNMDYLYMAARETDVQKPTEANQGVKLEFQPLTSTLEITFVGPMEHPMASFNVFANDGESIAGHFSCDLTDEDFTCTPTSQGTTSTYVTVSTYWNDNGTQRPLKLGDGESITFNVFLLPHDNLDNLSVRVAGFNAASKTAQLTENGNSLVVYPHKKSIVKLPAPKSFGKTNNWISGLPDNVYVSQLSIPGTANSFSYNYSDDNPNPTWYKTQTATFEEQWNAGIRCFELKCPETTGDLGNVTLQCNRTDIGITFKAAVDEIWKKVQGTGEFAMIIPAFESGTGHPTTGDDAYKGVRNFANALNTFFNNNKQYEYITYGRNIILDDARGKLMFVARITSEEDEGEISDITPAQGVFIEGWGSLKDLWARRGYNVPNWAQNGDFSNKYMEYYMINGNTDENLNNFTFNGPVDGENNFMHTTIREDGSTGTAYVQDWSRVSPESKNYQLWWTRSWNFWEARYDYTYQNCYWPESFREKCADVWSTFLAAIEDNNNQQGSTFYINSLDGFYIDENIPLSYKPYIAGRTDPETNYGYGDGGTAGNIVDYANDINDYFYNQILKFGEDNIYGPMNVVLLDMVYATDAGSYLPSVIINNNYRFPLMTNEEAANQSESQFNNGGNAIK